jgi:hypothetical protein
MFKIKIISIILCLVILILNGSACISSTTVYQEESRQVAEEFVKLESTFHFDGLLETFMVTGATPAASGWEFTIEFDSRHAGYGDRSGQILAQVITHHTVEITVQTGEVTSAIMDGIWDMMNQRLLDDFEISLAPIHEVKTYIMKSNPPQIGVYIKGGLRDGCTEFHDIEITRESNIVNIKVTTKHPKNTACPAVYGFFEKDINLGSDFIFGTTYILKVNDYSTTFLYQ